MKAHEITAVQKRAKIIKRLEELGHKGNDHYTYRELLRKLSAAEALEVKVQSPHSQWF